LLFPFDRGHTKGKDAASGSVVDPGLEVRSCRNAVLLIPRNNHTTLVRYFDDDDDDDNDNNNMLLLHYVIKHFSLYSSSFSGLAVLYEPDQKKCFDFSYCPAYQIPSLFVAVC
jgi:hypothetical protein